MTSITGWIESTRSILTEDEGFPRENVQVKSIKRKDEKASDLRLACMVTYLSRLLRLEADYLLVLTSLTSLVKQATCYYRDSGVAVSSTTHLSAMEKLEGDG